MRLFINIHYLEIGGAETALIGFLRSLDYSKVSVDLFLNDPRGEMMRFIPEEVNLIQSPMPYRMIERPMKEALRNCCFRLVATRLYAEFKFRQFCNRKHPKDGNAIFGYVSKYTTLVLPSLKELGEYDLAISFLTPHDIVLKKVKAKKKVCWIHTDYSSIDVDRDLELPVWAGYDRIVSISDDVSETFSQVFPELKGKLMKFENIISRNFIKERADAFIPSEMAGDAGVVKVLTIGRFSGAKNLDAIPSICRFLTDNGVNLKWYIIGYGNPDEEAKLLQAIQREDMQEKVVMLGKRDNPYPYIKACDFYVQPSRYEGKSITVKEAQILGKPVIVRNYPTAQSQVRNGVDGFIAPFGLDDFSRELLEIISDKEAVSKVIRDLASVSDNYRDAIREFFSSV